MCLYVAYVFGFMYNKISHANELSLRTNNLPHTVPNRKYVNVLQWFQQVLRKGGSSYIV